jgi:hypothetical protein
MSSPSQVNRCEPEAYAHPEVEFGGADSVQRTTFVRGAGTEPNRTSRGPSAAVPCSAPPALVTVLLVLAIVVAVIYLVGLAGR